MSIQRRKSQERGYFDHGWLKTHHTFSFGNYYDPEFMGFRDLRVINEDFVAPQNGFPPHPHQNMEIITLVLAGTLAHKDSMGHAESIKAGEIQVMSAGTGVKHAEYNPSNTEEVHLFQIWILPSTQNTPPSYNQRNISNELASNQWVLIASNAGRDGSFKIHQDVDLWVINLQAGHEVQKNLAIGRHAWVQVASGQIELNGQLLDAGDGVALSEETSLNIKANLPSQILLFDLN